MTNMKFISTLLLIAFLASPSSIDGFQFMSKWKMPTHDPNKDIIDEKFGDKSKLTV